MTKGVVAEIKGGGLYGEGMRLLQNYPGTKDLTYPFLKKPGYWWLYEAGLGTNPKYFKHPAEVSEGNNLSERNVAGTIHWAFGTEVAMGPDKVNEWAAETEDFARKNQLPRGHSMHNHNLLPTFQVRIRDLDQWVTIIEHGGLTALDDTFTFAHSPHATAIRARSCAATTSRHRPASMRPEPMTAMRAIRAPTGQLGRSASRRGRMSISNRDRTRDRERTHDVGRQRQAGSN